MNSVVFQWFNHFFSREWAVFFTACLPIVELRGAIPLAISLGIPPLQAFLLGVIGNAFPVIPLLFFLSPIRKYCIDHSLLMEHFFNWLDKRTLRYSDRIDKYGALALILFTAIPFPTTGAWTASFAALLFKIKFRHALFAILTGIILAGFIVLILSLTGRAILDIG
jgi:uncharacterized membrane protein